MIADRDAQSPQWPPEPVDRGAVQPSVVGARAGGATDDRLFTDAFGEPLTDLLNLDTWRAGDDLAALYLRLEREVAGALTDEDHAHARIRRDVLPQLARRPVAPRDAGVFRVTPAQVERVHRGLLFTGAVEACDGASAMLDTMPVTIARVGVGLVSYRGDQGTLMQHLFRRDLRIKGDDASDDVIALLDARMSRGAVDRDSTRDALTQLARRGLMTYAERAALVERCDARWRIGQGVPAPLELLTGSGSSELLIASLDVLERLILGHQRFRFVPSGPEHRMLLTIGGALQPLEFAVIDTAEWRMAAISQRNRFLGAALDRRLRDFVHEAGAKIAVGVYRASRAAPPYLFYSHVDFAHETALIAIANSTLQEHRGFPLLIDLADAICRAAFGAEIFASTAQAVYAAHGAPFRYLGERQTRR